MERTIWRSLLFANRRLSDVSVFGRTGPRPPSDLKYWLGYSLKKIKIVNKIPSFFGKGRKEPGDHGNIECSGHRGAASVLQKGGSPMQVFLEGRGHALLPV